MKSGLLGKTFPARPVSATKKSFLELGVPGPPDRRRMGLRALAAGSTALRGFWTTLPSHLASGRSQPGVPLVHQQNEVAQLLVSRLTGQVPYHHSTFLVTALMRTFGQGKLVGLRNRKLCRLAVCSKFRDELPVLPIIHEGKIACF